MVSLTLGIGGFLLYLLYDVNSFTYRLRLLHGAFALGTLLVGAATALDLLEAWRLGAFSGPGDAALLLAAGACLAALVYSLFFALPFQETYRQQEQGRHVYDGGVYALCRHPGILCFFGLYLCLGLAALPGGLLAHGLAFSLLDLAYAGFQDRVTFPKTFCDYEAYRKKAPFLIPTGDSIRRARQTWGRPASEEERPRDFRKNSMNIRKRRSGRSIAAS